MIIEVPCVINGISKHTFCDLSICSQLAIFFPTDFPMSRALSSAAIQASPQLHFGLEGYGSFKKDPGLGGIYI